MTPDRDQIDPIFAGWPTALIIGIAFFLICAVTFAILVSAITSLLSCAGC